MKMHFFSKASLMKHFVLIFLAGVLLSTTSCTDYLDEMNVNDPEITVNDPEVNVPEKKVNDPEVNDPEKKVNDPEVNDPE